MTSAAPGWYHAEGDPPGTHRYWDGNAWSPEPVPIQQPSFQAPVQDGAPATQGFPAAPPEFTQFGQVTPIDRSPWQWFMFVVKDNYANFSGRARRKEYWWFTVVSALLAMVLVIPAVAMLATETDAGGVVGAILILLTVVFYLALLVPSIAVSVRRLHDTDKSGWWYLLAVIPIINYIGGLIILVFMFLDGNPGPNQYGPDPKGRA